MPQYARKNEDARDWHYCAYCEVDHAHGMGDTSKLSSYTIMLFIKVLNIFISHHYSFQLRPFRSEL